jgi:Domain of unknown function (DUF6970)
MSPFSFTLAVTMMLTLAPSAACERAPTTPDSVSLPWLNTLIARLEAEPVANPPALIARYDYAGQSVYFLPQRCCDQMSVLYREDGTTLCHPDGGITGSGDRRCPSFFSERRNEHIIWRDTRTR